DGGYSGSNTDRPAMQEMISNIKNVDAVVVYKLDRLSRSQKDTLYLIEDVFLENEVDFISLSESFDTSTPFGRAMIGILSVFAQLEREQITERTNMGRLARAKDGYYHGGSHKKTPIGYDYVNGELKINEYEADCVRYVFEEYAKGKGIEAINSEVRKRYPNLISGPSVIRKMLLRHLYKGYVMFDKQLFKGKHDPIINERDFDNVQMILSKKRSRTTNKTLYMLSGLLTCGHCGARMSGTSTGRYRYYVCYSVRGTPHHMVKDINCKSKRIRKEVLEGEIIKQLSKLKLSDVHVEKKDNNQIDNLQKELNNIDNQIANTVELYSLGNVSIDVIKKRIDELNTKKESITKRIDELSNNKINEEGIKKVISSLKDFDKWEDEKKQIALMKLIERITVY